MYYQPNENALDQLVHRVLPNLGSNYQLTVIGITPPYLKDKYHHKKVTFKEGVVDWSSELLEHDIALAPLYEGSGTRLKILDYLASGLPIVTTTIGVEGLDPAIKEYVSVEDDIANYASRVESIASNLPSYAKRAASGRLFVEAHYEWSRCIQPFLDAYSYLSSKQEMANE